jgi:hypothetical protein
MYTEKKHFGLCEYLKLNFGFFYTILKSIQMYEASLIVMQKGSRMFSCVFAKQQRRSSLPFPVLAFVRCRENKKPRGMR